MTPETSTERSPRRLVLRVAGGLVGCVLAILAADWLVGKLDPMGAIAVDTNGQLYQKEVVTLVPGSARIFKHRPDVDVAMRGLAFRTNSLGLRGPEIELPKPPGRKRVLLLGDSVVLGWGVAQEDTFSHLLAGRLRETVGGDWETINGGHLLHDSTQELAVLEEVGFVVDPDIVLLVFVENDIVLTREVQQAAAPDSEAQRSEDAERFLRRRDAINSLRPYLPNIGATLSFLYVQSTARGAQGSSEHAEEMGLSLEAGWQEASGAIETMHQECTARGIRFAVLDYRRDNRLSSTLEAFCGEQSIPYRSIAFTEEEERDDLTVSPAESHANPLGHRYLTEHILEAMFELGLVERGG